MAMLATAYERPVAAHVLAKLRRACERWTEGDKALAHIHLAHAGLPPCGEAQALRLIVAEELIEIGVTPAGLMKAQDFDLDLWKYSPDQPRVPPGSGRESGEWTDGEAYFTPVAFHPRRGRGHRRGRSWLDAIRGFLESLGEWRKPKDSEPAPEAKPSHEEDAEPENAPPKASLPELEISSPKPSDFVGQDFGKLGVGVEKPELSIGEFSDHATESIAEYGASLTDLRNTVANPLIVFQQSDGRFFYLSEKAVVVLDQRGRVITIYTEQQFDQTIRNILEYVLKRGEKCVTKIDSVKSIAFC